MSRLTDLIEAVKRESPTLGEDLAAEIKTLINRRTFGLVFERHKPEAVELPGLQVDVGSKVHILPPRGSVSKQDNRLWKVNSIDGQTAHLSEQGTSEPENREVHLGDLVVVAEFRDPIFSGLVETGRVERGGEKPYHSVINAENYHALEMLTYTHRHSVDAIYIDPPYNTGARDWKYNNDYVEGDDDYRHSKWLAFMERRLLIAKELLDPEDSVLIVTIDEKEYLRLGLLLEQTFPEANIQMVSVAISSAGVSRPSFSRTDEFYFFVTLGRATPKALALGDEWSGGVKRQSSIRWESLLRSGNTGRRIDRPNLFYPVLIAEDSGKLVGFGESLPLHQNVESYKSPEGTLAVFPRSSSGDEARWRISAERARALATLGAFRVGNFDGERATFSYLKQGELEKVKNGTYQLVGYDDSGAMIVDSSNYRPTYLPSTQWNVRSHNAGSYGSSMLRYLIPGRKFPFPKSLYAVEDALRFFVSDKPDAVVLDFFAGSGTTQHAVMRLNRQDCGRRQCISVTNNEVSADEHTTLRRKGLRPGDDDWEALGICDHVTKPRITAAITGRTPSGEPIKGDYKFADEFPMAAGFEENAVFYTLTYESALRVRYDLAFERIAPMLWLRAGARGRVIERVGEPGFEIADTYAVVKRPDRVRDFVDLSRVRLCGRGS